MKRNAPDSFNSAIFKYARAQFAAVAAEGRSALQQAVRDTKKISSPSTSSSSSSSSSSSVASTSSSSSVSSSSSSVCSSSSSSSSSSPSPTPLSAQQLVVIQSVKDGHNVFITGEGGCGKSHLLQALRDILPAASTSFTASTGIAALPLGGTTVHAFAGFGHDTSNVIQQAKRIRDKLETYERWMRTTTLVIDEVSMLHLNVFEFLDQVAREIKDNNRPFGGMQLICSGDFLQLPPVEKNRDITKIFAFQSALWDQTFGSHQYVLKQIFRQTDVSTQSVLSKIRRGVVDDSVMEGVRPCIGRKFKANGIKPTLLFPTRAQVDLQNESELKKLGGAEHVFTAIDSYKSWKYKEFLQKDCIAPEVLALKIGAQVMMLKNMSDGGVHLVNGSRGVVVGWDHETGSERPVVKWLNGARTAVGQASWDIKEGTRTMASRIQTPLILAWALTMHKAQGMTLDSMVADLAKGFAPGQIYVALSRARDFASLGIVGEFQRKLVRANADALQFYEKLEGKAKEVSTSRAAVTPAADAACSASPCTSASSSASPCTSAR